MKSAKCEIAAGSGSRAKLGRDPRFALDRAMSQRQSLSMQTLRRIEVENLWSLKKVSVDLGPLNVLVGPNGAGKTNLLKAIGFLGDVARLDLMPAIRKHGGPQRIFYRGVSELGMGAIIRVAGEGSGQPKASGLDEYTLSFKAPWIEREDGGPIDGIGKREEELKFGPPEGGRSRIEIRGSDILVGEAGSKAGKLSISEDSAALATLPRLGQTEGGAQMREIAELFMSFRIYDPVVERVRLPSPKLSEPHLLEADASNLGPYLLWLREHHEARFARFVDDMRAIVPGLEDIEIETIGGASEGAKIVLLERGLRGKTDLAEASFGTIRAMAILAMLHEPEPARLRCVEEIDHGLHPHALDRLVERLREASARGQILVATHSPALVNRLRASELIVCERDPETGASRIPAITTEEIEALMSDEEVLGLGELWFSGVFLNRP